MSDSSDRRSFWDSLGWTRAPRLPLSSKQVADLRRRAASCYLRAGDHDAAIRLFEELADFRQAGMAYEQSGRPELAAVAHGRAGNWRRAAACFFESGRYEDAAEAYERLGDPVEAAWVWADRVHRYERARELVRRVEPGQQVTAIAIEIVEARCQAGGGSPVGAARQLLRIVDELRGTSTSSFSQVWDRCVAIAAALRRPDLAQVVFAAEVAAGVPHAEQRWEEWARTSFSQQR